MAGFFSFCSSARARALRAEFSIIPPLRKFVNRQFTQKFFLFFSQNVLDFCVPLCYTIITGDGKKPARDKLGYRAMWKSGVVAHPVLLKKIFKNPLTPIQKCDRIVLSDKERNEIKWNRKLTADTIL